mmetsp:Transcript_657/g.1502  ORF Transcript_657/g.1502 Transcript_657/m.1502 type:complete len:88 (-) Transcript_657:747-1010(-)
MNRPEMVVLGILGVSVFVGLSQIVSDSMRIYRNLSISGENLRNVSVVSDGMNMSTLKAACPIKWGNSDAGGNDLISGNSHTTEEDLH